MIYAHGSHQPSPIKDIRAPVSAMTKDLALLVSPDQGWLTTNQFLDKLDEELKQVMGL